MKKYRFINILGLIILKNKKIELKAQKIQTEAANAITGPNATDKTS